MAIMLISIKGVAYYINEENLTLAATKEQGMPATLTTGQVAKAQAVILQAALEELRWGPKDPRHDHAAWKEKLRQQLWTNLGYDYPIYT